MAMVKNYFILGVLFLWVLNIQAQFTDDMESYTDGEPISGSHWTDWGCGGGGGCALMSSSAQAHNGLLSGLIPGDGTTNAVLDLGNKIFGEWGILFWMYIPSGKEAAITIQGEVPINEGESIVGDILFNPNLVSPGNGVIADSALGEVAFSFPHDEWFRVIAWWDIYSGIDLATWELYIDGFEVLPPGTPFTNENGDAATSLGGIQFASSSLDTEFYLDDIIYQTEFIVGYEDFTKEIFTMYPNPSNDYLSIFSNEIVENVIIYNLVGVKVLETTSVNSINISALRSGMYLVVVETVTGKGVQKLIKK
jgi:hypothetical protein